MASIFDLLDPMAQPAVPRPEDDALSALNTLLDTGRREIADFAHSRDIHHAVVAKHAKRMLDDQSRRGQGAIAGFQGLMRMMRDAQAQGTLAADWSSYLTDSRQRLTLALDALRQRGDGFLDHEARGCPPVLIYDYEIIMEGRDLPYPCNFFLMRILPPAGIEVKEWKRPYLIVDPRAGHGPGIGGFKVDSQVGVALGDGHPVYFVGFHPMPEPGQYLAYVTRAKAAFVREVMRRHPQSPKPIVVGNCQGGWATLLLAATNPDLTGPIVINGAPVATWAGEVGQNPLRYNAGVLGGTWIPMFLADLGGGIFDGAHLVQNFELLNPSRTLFRKYADLYRDIDKGAGRFLEFERWWGGFFLMTEAEIRWIVEQLFVGNRLVKNEARLEPGRPVDIKAIRSPIIVFASHGDNITPPQQALNWIAETYADVSEIRIRGQRIIYMTHEDVGHLGIFVSSQIAKREHTEVASTLKTIEALAPGLYEMRIEESREENGQRHSMVGFLERTLDDIRALDDGHFDERPFAAVARSSELQSQFYDLMFRPFIKASITPSSAEFGRALHPQRLSRALLSSKNPVFRSVATMAAQASAERSPADPQNPFLKAEALWFDLIEQSIDFWRDQRDMMSELAFYGIWSTPWFRAFGRSHETRRTLKSAAELRSVPEVAAALFNMERGGFVEAVIRMLVLLAESRQTVRKDRLERASRVLNRDEPFKSLTAEQRAMIIHEQTLIATYEPERAIETLPILLRTPEERLLAAKVVRFIPGAISDMSPQTLSLLQRFHEVLGLPPFTEDVPADPLAEPGLPEAASIAAEAEPARPRRQAKIREEGAA
jgi:pimeloyl-ACP methyl ester carboxylesterase